MADIPNAQFDIDQVLTSTMRKVAQQADTDTTSTTQDLMDAIRQRVADGDTGTPAPGSTAPGWGGGVSSWAPWLGLIVVGALVGGGVGVSGLAGRPEGETTVDIPVAIGDSAPVSSCVDGPVVGRIPAGTRALAVQRSDDALWVGIRDPRTLGGTLWVTLGDISLDDGEPALDELPVGGACPEPAVVTLPAPEPVVTEETAPQPGPNPQPPAPTPDTTPPSVGPLTVNTGLVGSCSFAASVPASDNIGVSGVTLTWTNPSFPASNGSAAMTFQSGVWNYSYTGTFSNFGGNYTFTAVARDAAGNTATSGSVTKNIQCLG